jgi:hypothetical protein
MQAMPEAAFVLSDTQPQSLHELAATVGHELDRQGVPSALHLDGFPAQRPDRVYVWMDPSGYLDAEGPDAVPDDAVLRRTVFVYDEHRVPTDDDHLELARRAGAVFALDTESARALHLLGISARVMRPGYSAIRDRYEPDAARPVDVVFLGSRTARRTHELARAAPVLSRYRCQLHLPDGPGDAAFIGEARWRLLMATKVVLNLHCGEGSDLEWRRVVDAVHAGAVVVTEHSTSIAPLVPGQHLLVASADALPFVAEALLRDPARLAAMRAAAYERLSSWLPFSLPVSVLRAALVELVGERSLPGASLGRPPRRVLHSPVPDVRPPARRVAPSPNGGGPSGASPARRPGEVVWESPAWSPHEPRVSVVLTIAGASGLAVLETLGSVRASRMTEFELVVVDDASSAMGADAARGWLDAHPEIPSRLLLVRCRDIGVGPARNAGLRSARAAAALIIDGGQAVYPRCLGELVDALERAGDQTAVVYPIQQVTDSVETFVAAGGDFLMSFAAWDPARLRAGSPVHTPALVRRDAVLSLGGFTSDIRLRTFEDYDLWCRMAERGFVGQLVPELLARRPESGASPVLRCLHPVPGLATAALIEHSPGVLAGAAFARS